MTKTYLVSRICSFSIILSLLISCNGQSVAHAKNNPAQNVQPKDISDQLGEYLISIFEDSKGNLWFGTLSKGVAKYDGKSLTYLTVKDGLLSNRVGSILEDSDGNLWFGTGFGVSKYNGETFVHYTEEDGLCDNSVKNILFDKKGILWIGTLTGVCTFNGHDFSSFPLPKPDLEVPYYQETTYWVSEIYEDSKGNMWFGRDGYGVCMYDGNSFAHFSKKQGLPSNNIIDIQEDKYGNMWFTSRVTERDHPDANKRHGTGGLVKYDGANMIDFPDIEGLINNDVYQIYRDSKDNLWVSTVSHGIYKYDGNTFINYVVSYEEEKISKPVVSVLEDSNGIVWVGCAGGLFRLDSGRMVNVTKNGPW